VDYSLMGRHAIAAGSLNRRARILRRGAGSDDGYGKQPGAWTELASRLCSVKPRMGREKVEGLGLQALAVMSFWFRFDNTTRTIVATDALELDGVHYEIVAPPIVIGLNAGIEVLAVAGSVDR
jgi:head-tail adaptor